MVRGYGRGRWRNSNLKDTLGVMGMEEAKPNLTESQGINSNPSESTLLGIFLISRSRFGVIRIDSTFQNEFQRAMRVDSGNTRVDSHESRFLKWCLKALQNRLLLFREVNEGIHGINFPASGNSRLSVLKGCLRDTHVVKYRHMMITWKSPIIKIEQALGVM
ncbi:hypothetical protein PIB30_022847 [Stylosanthes scabra]|uniref:Uncharacterized protein n=1 Tax=Stylosanthes scabra TaxID=79078 RepID=A0ABU6WB73_9FABA|nr:hypothetical protein [Stylosanthes scabra]